MWYINIIAASPIENRLVLKDKMEKSVSLKTETASTDKPNGKPSLWDKILGSNKSIHFYVIEDSDNNEEGGAAYILVIHD